MLLFYNIFGVCKITFIVIVKGSGFVLLAQLWLLALNLLPDLFYDVINKNTQYTLEQPHIRHNEQISCQKDSF